MCAAPVFSGWGAMPNSCSRHTIVGANADRRSFILVRKAEDFGSAFRHMDYWSFVPPPFKLAKHIIADIFFSEDLQRCPKHFAFFVRHWWTPHIFPPYRTQEPRYSPSIRCGLTIWYIIIRQAHLSSTPKAGPLGPLRSQILYKSILVHGGQMWYNGDAKEFQTAFSELP